jgi:dTDP-4-amino-4,6-dideoxygalactose transaminase
MSQMLTSSNNHPPYPSPPINRSPEKDAPRTQIPLVDLIAQHQAKRQELDEAIQRVIANARFIQGQEVREFEEAFARFCGQSYCIGTSNGTDALTLALGACGIAPGDEVITTPHTFIATAEAILAVGARPVFADIDEQTFTIDPQRIEERITERTRAIIPVHLYGQPAALEEIMALAQLRGLRVIGDAAQAHGAELKGRSVAQWGDAACFSFFPGKNLGAFGDAGGVVTSDPEIAQRVGMLRDHGRWKEKYTHTIVGGNYRLDTIQAAVLLVKLQYLAQWNEARRRVARLYREGLDDLPVQLPVERAQVQHVYHQFVIRTPLRAGLAAFLKEQGVATGIHYPVPLHLQPALQHLGYQRGDFPVTERVVDDILSLPIYPEMTDQQVGQVIETIRWYFQSH